jgi:hypothetical protein
MDKGQFHSPRSPECPIEPADLSVFNQSGRFNLASKGETYMKIAEDTGRHVDIASIVKGNGTTLDLLGDGSEIAGPVVMKQEYLIYGRAELIPCDKGPIAHKWYLQRSLLTSSLFRYGATRKPGDYSWVQCSEDAYATYRAYLLGKGQNETLFLAALTGLGRR